MNLFVDCHLYELYCWIIARLNCASCGTESNEALRTIDVTKPRAWVWPLTQRPTFARYYCSMRQLRASCLSNYPTLAQLYLFILTLLRIIRGPNCRRNLSGFASSSSSSFALCTRESESSVKAHSDSRITILPGHPLTYFLRTGSHAKRICEIMYAMPLVISSTDERPAWGIKVSFYY